MEVLAPITLFGLGIVYSIIIYLVLHSMFNYVFWGDGFLMHLFGVFMGGFILSAITLYFWKIAVVAILIIGGLIALGLSGRKRIVAVVITLIMAILICYSGILGHRGMEEGDDTASYTESVYAKSVQYFEKNQRGANVVI